MQCLLRHDQQSDRGACAHMQLCHLELQSFCSLCCPNNHIARNSLLICHLCLVFQHSSVTMPQALLLLQATCRAFHLLLTSFDCCIVAVRIFTCNAWSCSKYPSVFDLPLRSTNLFVSQKARMNVFKFISDCLDMVDI